VVPCTPRAPWRPSVIAHSALRRITIGIITRLRLIQIIVPIERQDLEIEHWCQIHKMKLNNSHCAWRHVDARQHRATRADRIGIAHLTVLAPRLGHLMIKITFDTNTFDKVVRPQVYARDPDHGRFMVIHEAIKDRRIAGFLCDAIVTLEGIKVDDRAEVLGSTTLTSEVAEEGPETIRVDLCAEEPLRSPLHHKQAERFVAALALGINFASNEHRPSLAEIEWTGAMIGDLRRRSLDA
jgi:hypothetical protein